MASESTTISAESKILTLVNVFTVDPAKQQELIDLLIDATQKRMRDLPGFISASIHKSLDGKQVVNYAQWRSVKDFEAIRNDPEAGKHMQKAAAMAEFNPIVTEVVFVDHA